MTSTRWLPMPRNACHTLHLILSRKLRQRQGYFFLDFRIAFCAEHRLQCASCATATEASQRPGGMAAHQRFSLMQRHFQGWQRPQISQISQGHSDVAQQASPFGAGDGTAAEPGEKLLIREAKQRHELGGGEASAWQKCWFRRLWCLAIPWTNRLTDVTPEDVCSQQGSEVAGDRAA